VNYDAADAITDAIALAGSAVQVEMAVRVGQSLERGGISSRSWSPPASSMIACPRRTSPVAPLPAGG
jgi:hypothetical protein